MSNDFLRHMLTAVESQGFTVDDLMAIARESEQLGPQQTYAEWVDRVLQGLGHNTARSYRTHFEHLVKGINRQCECTCDRCLREFETTGTCTSQKGVCKEAKSFSGVGESPVSTESAKNLNLEVLVSLVRSMAQKRSLLENASRAQRGLAPKPTHGQGAQEMCVTALRALFASMERAGAIKINPALALKKGDRSETKRRSLNDAELAEVFRIASSGGDDPELDLALVWTEFELGARRGGIISLTIGQLDPVSQTITLHEKGNKQVAQPCSLKLIRHLEALAISRGGQRCNRTDPAYNPNARVFYYKDSTAKHPHPITSRRFDTLHKRIQLALPWANSMSFSGHALRHTIAQIAERMEGHETAERLLRHSRKGKDATAAYLQSSKERVARVVSTITGEPHPSIRND